MAKNPPAKPQPTAAEVLAKANTDLESANTALAKAEEDLQLAQGVGDEKDIAAAQVVLEQAQADQKSTAEAAVAAATAAAPAQPAAEAAGDKSPPAASADAATAEPEAQQSADPTAESELDKAELEVKAFVVHLADEIRAAEKSGDVKLHAWLVSLEGHLVGLKNHLAQEHPTATAAIESLVADVKALF